MKIRVTVGNVEIRTEGINLSKQQVVNLRYAKQLASPRYSAAQARTTVVPPWASRLTLSYNATTSPTSPNTSKTLTIDSLGSAAAPPPDQPPSRADRGAVVVSGLAPGDLVDARRDAVSLACVGGNVSESIGERSPDDPRAIGTGVILLAWLAKGGIGANRAHDVVHACEVSIFGVSIT